MQVPAWRHMAQWPLPSPVAWRQHSKFVGQSAAPLQAYPWKKSPALGVRHALGVKQPNWVPVPMQQAFDVRLHAPPRQSIVGAIQDPFPSQYNVVSDF